MKYKLNDKPKGLDMFLYGLQWFTATLPFLIILAGVVPSMHSDDLTFRTFYSQKIFFFTGIALFVQILWGHKLPLIIGPATVLLIGVSSTLDLSFNATYTAMAVGGLLMVLLSLGKLFKFIQKVFTPRVIAVTLLLVAISISPLIINMASGSHELIASNIAFAILLTLLMLICNNFLKGIWKSMVILIGLLFGSTTYLLLFPEQMPIANISHYDWSVVKDNIIINPEFNFSAILAFLFCFLALTVNEIGSVQAMSSFIEADDAEGRSKKGVGVTGIFNFVSAMFGTIGVVDYSVSPGIIAATRSASRYPLLIAAGLIILCAFIPQSLAVFAYIPQVVMGGVMLYMMSSQLGSGFTLMTSKKVVHDFNSSITVAFPVMLCILISFAPAAFTEAIPNLLKPILGNGFIMGIIAVLVLENTINRSSAIVDE